MFFCVEEAGYTVHLLGFKSSGRNEIWCCYGKDVPFNTHEHQDCTLIYFSGRATNVIVAINFHLYCEGKGIDKKTETISKKCLSHELEKKLIWVRLMYSTLCFRHLHNCYNANE